MSQKNETLSNIMTPIPSSDERAEVEVENILLENEYQFEND
jgi:hypothetical protein